MIFVARTIWHSSARSGGGGPRRSSREPRRRSHRAPRAVHARARRGDRRGAGTGGNRVVVQGTRLLQPDLGAWRSAVRRSGSLGRSAGDRREGVGAWFIGRRTGRALVKRGPVPRRGLPRGGGLLVRPHVRVHALFVERACAERASRRPLVDEHGVLAEGALRLPHLGGVDLVVQHERSLRSGGSGPTRIFGNGANALDETFFLGRTHAGAAALLLLRNRYAASISLRLRRLPREMYSCTGSCCQQKFHLL